MHGSYLIPHTCLSTSYLIPLSDLSYLLFCLHYHLIPVSFTPRSCLHRVSLSPTVLPRYCSATVLASVNLDPEGNPFIAKGGGEEEEEAPPVIVFHDEL